MKSKNIKIIKLLAPSRLSTAGKDEFMARLKPVLGQNQINLVTFVNDFHLKTAFLSEEHPIEVATQIRRRSDKSFSVEVALPGAGVLRHQFVRPEGQLGLAQLQDMLRLRIIFDRKAQRPLSGQCWPLEARILLANLRALHIQVKT